MIVISDGKSNAGIEEKGAYLSDLEILGRRIIKHTPDGEPTHGGSAVLIPYAGRVKGAVYEFDGVRYTLPKNNGENSIHGFLKDTLWRVIGSESDSVTLGTDFINPGYPTSLHTEITYTVSGDSFSVDVSTNNTGDQGAPLLVGFHPYFIFKDSWTIRHEGSMREMNYVDDFFPDGTYKDANFNSSDDLSGHQFDNCFEVPGKVSLITRDGTLAMTRKNMPYLVIYNGKYSEGFSVALEPMTGAPDAFNNGIGLIELESGGTHSCGFSVQFQKKS